MGCTERDQLGTERFLAPEILFNPEIIGQEHPGVHQVSALSTHILRLVLSYRVARVFTSSRWCVTDQL